MISTHLFDSWLPGRKKARQLFLFLTILLTMGTFSACTEKETNDKDRGHKAPRASRCPRATLAWSVSGSDSPYKRAGLSTNPAGREEHLMAILPGIVHGWAKACRSQGHWACSSTAIVGFVAKDDTGNLGSIEAITACPAAKCLAEKAAQAKLTGHLTKGTDICVYLELGGSKKPGK